MNYLQLRNINQESINHFGLEMIEIKNNEFLKIPYDNDSYTLRIAKKKKTDKYNKDFLKPQHRLSMFNYSNIDKNQDSIFITIGELNSIVMWQLGYKNVVGINCNNIEEAKHIFATNKDILNFKKVFLLQDNSQFGRELSYKLKEKNKRIEIVDIKKYKGYKDINELLYIGDNYCHMLIRSFVNDLDIINLSSFNINELREVPKERVSFGINWLNTRFNGLETGRVYGVTGPTGHGKSVLTNQIVLNAIQSNKKTLIIDGEEAILDRIENMYYPLLANTYKENVKQYVDRVQDGFIFVNQIKPNVVEKIQLWHKNKLFLYSSNYTEENINTDDLFKKVRKSIVYDGIEIIVIDNLMSLNKDDKREVLEAQYNFVAQCQKLAKKYDVTVLLCMHLRKYTNIEDVTFNDICGSSNIPNLLDGLLMVYRLDEGTSEEKSYMKILKNRPLGKFGRCEVKFKDRYFLEFDPIGKTFIDQKFSNIEEFLGEDKETISYLKNLEDMEQQLINWEEI